MWQKETLKLCVIVEDVEWIICVAFSIEILVLVWYYFTSQNEQVLIDACLKGCDVFLVKQAAEKNIFINPFTALQRSDDRAALIKCTNGK